MEKVKELSIDHYLFSAERIGEVSVLTFKEKPLLHIADLEAKEALFSYLELVACHDDIKVLMIKSAQEKMECTEYVSYYQRMIASSVDKMPLERMYNAVNQSILQLKKLDKMVIHTDSGKVILLFLNISLACDYRIVADNTVYQNPNIELGVVPKGGAVFFLSKMLGTAAASKLLFSREDITAVQARQLGIVDQVVPLEDLDRIAMETAKIYAQLPSSYVIGIKNLLNFMYKGLNQYLEFENVLLRKLIRSRHLANFKTLDENS